MTIKTITRKTRHMGWGYSTYCKQSQWNTLVVPPPENPIHVGTLHQIFVEQCCDRTLASLRSGTVYSTRWFYNGHPIKSVNGNTQSWAINTELFNLMDKTYPWLNSVEIEY